MSANARLIDPELWRLPLAERMCELGEMREAAAFTPASFENPMTGETEHFVAATRYAEVVEISKRPAGVLLRQGCGVRARHARPRRSTSSGRSSTWTTRRHARQRGIVARSFTPRQLQNVLDSVDTICSEVIDGFCEQGEADLVKVLSQPFPLLVICDMMGIPRSEFDTVLKATNVILGGGDPEYMGDGDPMLALFEAGMQPDEPHERAGRGASGQPHRRPHVEAGPQRRRRGDARAQRDRAVLHPARRRRQRHHAHGDQPRREPALAEPRPARRSGRPTSKR